MSKGIPVNRAERAEKAARYAKRQEEIRTAQESMKVAEAARRQERREARKTLYDRLKGQREKMVMLKFRKAYKQYWPGRRSYGVPESLAKKLIVRKIAYPAAQEPVEVKGKSPRERRESTK